MSTKRRQYRVKPSGADSLDIAVPTASKEVIRGKVEDLSVGGVKVFFERRADPHYELREVVNLQVLTPHQKKPLIAPSMVSHRAEEEEGFVYGFEFIDWLGLLSQLPRDLKTLFNRRGELRVPPHPERPIEVTILVPVHAYRARVCVLEISAGGLSFVVGIEAEEVFRDLSLLDLWLHLPNSSTEVRFTGKIIDRDLVHDGIRYGIFLLAEETKDFQRKKDILAAYVAVRRREILGLPLEAELPKPVVAGDR